MKKKISLLLTGILTLGFLSGCGSQGAEGGAPAADTGTDAAQNTAAADAGTDGQPEEPSADAVEIVAWHDNDEAMMNALADAVNEKLKGDNITLRFEKKSDVIGQIRLYGTDAANGSDMYLFAHDSLGGFAEMGILEPVGNLIAADKETDLLPMTIEAASYKGEQYLMPVYYETLLFMYNKDLWEGEVPSTTEALYEYMTAHTDENAGTYALVNQHSNSYNVAPFINGFGGYIIDAEGNPGLDAQTTVEAIRYNQKFAKLQAGGDYNTVTALFNEGKGEALTKVLEALAEPEVGVTLAKGFNCAPANSKADDDC